MFHDVNFDGLVGLTHNYAGLGHGNLASQTNLGTSSNPRQAALEGLDKMAVLIELGIPQGVFPPHERPNLQFLRNLGFSGTGPKIFEDAWRNAPQMMRIALSASPMWVANAATVTRDHKGRVHFTAANLASQLHRAMEADFTRKSLKRIFESEHFRHHTPLPAHISLGDEGAANHMTLRSDETRLEVFVYGNDPGCRRRPKKHAARQMRAASEAVARQHGIPENQAIFLQQNADAIDQGVFHNDVIAVNHGAFLFVHELAFEAGELARLQDRFSPLTLAVVPNSDVSVQEAVKSYLFNSQIISTAQGLVLIAPSQVNTIENVRNYLDKLIDQEVLHRVICQPLDESMKNGGGPACLRLRVPITPSETQSQPCMLNTQRLEILRTWVVKHYPDHLDEEALRDPSLIHRAHQALDELTQILELGDFYDFQLD